MRWAVVLLLAPAALAGCLGGGADGGAGPAAGVPADGEAAAANRTGNLSALPPLPDPWLDATDLLLFEATVEVDYCWLPVEGAVVAPFTLTGHAFVQYGCGIFLPPPGVLVPPGTAALRVEGDASRATRTGSWGVYVDRTYSNSYDETNETFDTEETAQAQGTFRFPLWPDDWDLPHHGRSAFAFSVYGWGQPGVDVLRGPVDLKVFAERDPAWTPPAPVDHFRAGDRHRILGEGVIGLLDENVTWWNPPLYESMYPLNLVMSPDWPEPPPLRDIVPVGTRAVTVALRWGDISGCPPDSACEFRATFVSGTTWIYHYNESAAKESGDGWRTYTYPVPAAVTEDGDWATQSRNNVRPFIVAGCPSALTAYGCGGTPPLQRMEGDLRIVVDAWESEQPDLAALKVRLGIA